jgi:MurNAc alpha-1-phosphate uridylyltransferase
MRPSAVMLFAAGRGTRMGALTATRPKPLIEVAGRALIDHALALVEEAGLERIVVNTHYLADQLESHLAGRPDIRLSREAPDLLDTGGGLKQALAEAWDSARMDGLLLLVPRQAAHGHKGAGDFVADAAGRLCRGPGEIYSGAQIIKTRMLAEIPDAAFSLNRLWDRMLESRRLHGVSHAGAWCDVGHPEGIAEAATLLAGADDV